MAVELRQHRLTGDKVTPYDLAAIQENVAEALRAMSKSIGIPIGGLLFVPLTAVEVSTLFDSAGLGLANRRWAGWAISNGNTYGDVATQNLASRFVRINNDGGNATGGSDSSAHTHAVDPASFTSGAGSAHSHTEGSLVNAAEASHTHGVGSMVADILTSVAAARVYSRQVASDSFTTTHEQTVSAAATTLTGTAPDSTGLSGTSGAGSSHNHAISGSTATEAAHTHAIDVPSTTSGAASVTENRPAYFDVVALVRVL